MARRSMLVAPLVVLIAVSTAARAEPIATGTPADLVLGPLQVAIGSDGDDVGASWVSYAVRFPSRRTGASLHGVLFVPDPLPASSEGGAEALPAVVISPGSGGLTEAGFRWAARDLAAHGYAALTIDPQGVGRSAPLGDPPCGMPAGDDVRPCPGVPFQQAATYLDAITSALDALDLDVVLSKVRVDPDRIGVAGHSLSARAAGYLQGIDPRIGAVVAWDNLASDLHGDEGSASGSRTTSSFVDGDLPGPEVPVLPRVPAMGMANGSAGSTTPTNRDPDIKKAGYDAWRAAEVPSMELVFASANHGSWWEPVPGRAGQRERELALFSYYTRAWFDRWLLDDTTATARLLAATVDGQPVAADLSASFRSAAFFDGTDCADLLTCGALGSTAAP